MSIQFTTVGLSNPAKPGGQKKYYIKPVVSKTLSLEDFAEVISEQSTTVSKTDFLAVLSLLEQELANCLLNGQNVHLGSLGYFHLSLQSEGFIDPKEASAKKIKGAKVRFVAGDGLTRPLKRAEYHRRPSN